MKKTDIPAILLMSAGCLFIILYIFTCIFIPYFLPSVTVPFAAGIVFVVIAAVRLCFKNKKSVIIITNSIMLVGIIIFVITQTMIFSSISSKPKNDFDYLIVLGCSLYNDTPSVTLKMRLDRAAEYAEKYPNAKIIVSGGQGNDEAIPESLAMERYLVRNGIEKERIIQENQSRNTIQNLRNTKEILDALNNGDNYSVAIVTSGFHCFRCKMIAKSVGFKKYCGISAPYPLSTSIFDHLRETASIIVFCLKRITLPL